MTTPSMCASASSSKFLATATTTLRIYSGSRLSSVGWPRAFRRGGSLRFEREAVDETLSEGANFEGSTAYHQFETEMFVWAAALRVDSGPRFHPIVKSQLEYLNALIRPDGTIPRVGDDDSGRVLPLSEYEAFAILDVGFSLISDAPRRGCGDRATLDLVWSGGADALERIESARPDVAVPGFRAFEDAEIHVVTRGTGQICLAAGPARVRAAGGICTPACFRSHGMPQGTSSLWIRGHCVMPGRSKTGINFARQQRIRRLIPKMRKSVNSSADSKPGRRAVPGSNGSKTCCAEPCDSISGSSLLAISASMMR